MFNNDLYLSHLCVYGGRSPLETAARDMHVTLKIPYVYNCITKVCRK
jgi:hypothetical protein